MANSKSPDVVGKKFNRLTVLDYSKASKSERIPSKVFCVCECGNRQWASYRDVKHGHTKSCGCYQREATSLARTTHGYRRRIKKPGMYGVWVTMRRRCNDSKDPKYLSYGARGIRVCKRWSKFENFLEDMGDRPKGMTLERKDNDKGYCKKNCRWATTQEQSRNKQQTVWVEVNGKRMCLKEATDLLGLKYGTIQARIRKGWSKERALSTPIKH